MDLGSKQRIENDIGEVDSDALYVLIDSPGGVLVENLAPLLTAIEELYRRLLVLRVDREVLGNL